MKNVFQEEERDDYITSTVVAKAEDRTMIRVPEFEAMCAKFWYLVIQQKGQNCTTETITQAQYTQLLLRIYKVLAPLYREAEMNLEVASDWVNDSKGQLTMNLALFQKFLFRIAHQWAASVSLVEYCELLQLVFDRITHREICRADGLVQTALPAIKVEIIQLKNNDIIEASDDEEGWESCRSQEEEDPDFLYKEKFEVRKKRRRDHVAKTKVEIENDVYNPREPFYFKEHTVYYNDQAGATVKAPTEQDFECSVLTELDNVLPLGYPSEQYMTWIKNDVQKAFLKLKAQKAEKLAAIKRELFSEGKKPAQGMSDMTNMADRDPGIVEEKGQTLFLRFNVYSSVKPVLIKTFAQPKDTQFNRLRQMLKDGLQFNLRPKFTVVKTIKQNQDAAMIQTSVPVQRRAENEYNPAVERRVNLKSLPGQNGKCRFMNVHYLIEDPVYETAYRCDVNRIETKEKLAFKPQEEFVREEEFCNVTTTFAQARQLMIQKKFETIFAKKLQGDDSAFTLRDDLVYTEELTRKMKQNTSEPLVSKNLTENFDDKTFIRNLQGPFYQLISQQGPKNDDFRTICTQDLIETANETCKRVLIIGKPRSGKTTLAKQLEKRLNLLRVSTEIWIQNLFKKIKDREENPPEEEPEPELEEGQEPPPKKSWLQPLEETVLRKLQDGYAPNIEEIELMLRQLITSPQALTQGYVLDLDFSIIESGATNILTWVQRLSNNVVPDLEFTHVVELLMDNDEIFLRAEKMRHTIQDGVVYSRWEREERNKPKIIPEGEEEPEEDDENAIKPIQDDDLYNRECDDQETVRKLVESYQAYERADFDTFISKLLYSSFIPVNAAGLNPDELAEAVTYKLKPNLSEPLTPVATVIEGASDFKGLLTEGNDPEEGILPRRWSLWKTVDPVALKKGQVVFGVPELACHYANNVFVFLTEDNLNEFVRSPRQYLIQAPQMPENYRVMILGPKGSGVHTQARIMQQQYGWQVVNFPEIVKNKISTILKIKGPKPPNNVTTDGPCMICMSETELTEVKDGKMLAAWKFLPWVLEYLGIPLMQKPPMPVVPVEEPNPETMEPEERKAYEKELKKKAEEKKKKDKEEDDLRKAKEERHRKRQEALDEGLDLEEIGLQETEEEIKIDDLPLDQLVPKTDEQGKIPFFGKYIMIGFPNTELQMQKLKEYGFGFDRLIFLNDTSEEEPGKELAKREMARKKSDFAYEWDKENEAAQKVLTAAKEFIGEDLIKEIGCLGTAQEVFIKIRTEIDPFFLLPDNPEDNRTTADDVNIEDEDSEVATKWLPKSDFGDYCPVTYVNANFLVKGSQEFESTVYGKTYWFAGEKEHEEFKFNPAKFLTNVQIPLNPQAPKIMLIGMKGAGVSSQIAKLCAKFKIESLELLPSFLAMMKTKKDQRKRTRLLDRGFRPPAPVEEEGAEPEPDAEIEDDPEDFDKTEHEKQLMQMILSSEKSLVIDGSWTSLPEDTVGLPLHELLFEARRTPEIVIVLRCKEETTLKRCIDEAAIKRNYEQIVQDRKQAAEKKREEDKLIKKAELIEENKPDPEAEEQKSSEEIEAIIVAALDEWTKNRIEEDIQAEEDDPEKPVFADMMEAEREKLREMREKEETMLAEFIEFLKEKKVEVVDSIQTEVSADYVHIKILDKLKTHMQFRSNLIEKEQCIPLTVAEVKNYERSYTYKHSKFGLSSPLTPFNPQKTKNFAVLYRERIYFLSDADEQRKFMLMPSVYTIGVEPVPQDLTLKPTACVLGLPKSGKSTLCTTLSSRTNMVHLQPEEIIESFIKRDYVFSAQLRQLMNQEGRQIDDHSMTQLLIRRIQMKDCQENGWVLEGYPKTRQQAVLMCENGIRPANIFHLQMPISEVYRRTLDQSQSDLGCDRTILVRRLARSSTEIPQVAYFFQKYYNNLSNIDGLKSQWFIEDLAITALENTITARLQFARDYFFAINNISDRCCVMQNLNYDQIYLKQSLSQFRYMCPVTWKQKKQFVNCCQRPEFTILYKHKFYYFAGAAERAVFCSNPSAFIDKTIYSTVRNVPILIREHKASEVIAQEKALLGHCVVTLKDEGRIEKGRQLVQIQYKDQRFIFSSQQKAARFYENPSRYSGVELPVKMPSIKDPVSFFSLQKKDESITLMEQALSSVVTRGLREVGENRLKYPTLSVKETMLKLFAIFLKADNPANTEYMREKYHKKMQDFIMKCEVPIDLLQLSLQKAEKQKQNGIWPDFKEEYYNKLGAQYDQIMANVPKERATGFSAYIK